MVLRGSVFHTMKSTQQHVRATIAVLLATLLVFSVISVAVAQPNQTQQQNEGLFGGFFDSIGDLFGGGTNGTNNTTNATNATVNDTFPNETENATEANETNDTFDFFGDANDTNATNQTNTTVNDTFPGEDENATEANETNVTNDTNQTFNDTNDTIVVNDTNATNQTNDTLGNETNVTNDTNETFNDTTNQTENESAREPAIDRVTPRRAGQPFNDTALNRTEAEANDPIVDSFLVDDGDTVQIEVYSTSTPASPLTNITIDDVRIYGDTIVVSFTQEYEPPCTEQNQTSQQPGLIGDAVQLDLDPGQYTIEYRGRAIFEPSFHQTCGYESLTVGGQ